MLRYSLVLLAGLWAAGAVSAGPWANALFEETSKDFGSVPRGPTLKHDFRLLNRTRTPVNIASVRVSCGCVTARAVKSHLQPGEETTIQTLMDTTRFTGAKTVTIYVQFNLPSYAEVRLWLQANGRNDFTVTPDTLAFGQVKRGDTPVAMVRVTFYGSGTARILGARGESNYVQPVIKEVRRLPHEVGYDLSVQLRADTPVGKWYTDVWLKTNLSNTPDLRVPLTVEVESPLTVSPPVVDLGSIKVASDAERKLIIRGVQPFKITQVKGIDRSLDVRFAPDKPREVHVLTVKVKPGQAGTFDRLLRVVTDLKEDNEIDFRVHAEATPR
jgi:hypothetical protein